MDPVSAIGLASAILSFVDFSWGLLAGTWEIHRTVDGTTDENAALEDVMGDLQSITDALQAKVPVKTRAERNVVSLAEDCQADSDALIRLLSGMKVPGTRRPLWKSLKASWKSIMGKDEVARLKGQLEDRRAEIQLNLITILHEDQSIVGKQLMTIERECTGMKIDMPVRLQQVRDELLEALGSYQTQASSTQQAAYLSLSQQLNDMQSLITTIPSQHRILRHLAFEGMGSRQSQILDAGADTCNWVFEPDKSVIFNKREDASNALISWLRTGGDILHMPGNPGSGKSTLMKFIAGHSRTKSELQVWAADKKLIFGHFFAWSAGGEKSQRSLSGLYRSILFQTLSQHPEFTEKLFPQQLKRMTFSRRSDGSDRVVEKLLDFDDDHIRDAFEMLLDHSQHDGYKICLLIDGLDEFEGNRLSHEDLAAKLKGWTTAGTVKLLVSSRPWPEFLDTFQAKSTIYLNKLNGVDIQTYCLARLRQDRVVKEMGEARRLQMEEVGQEVGQESQGIFLWACLVLDVILQSIRQGDSIAMLRAKTKEFPSDLDDLYSKLREQVERSPVDRLRSNRMLSLAANIPAGYALPILAFSWLLEDDDSLGLTHPNFPPETACQLYTEEEYAGRVERVERQMSGLTRGLLEISKDATPNDCPSAFSACAHHGWRIVFCHRTARDYLMLNEKRQQALRTSWPSFEDTDVYGRTWLAQLIYMGPCRGNKPENYEVHGSTPCSNCYRNESWKGCAQFASGGLTHSFCRDFHVDTIRRFEAPILRYLKPLWGGTARSRAPGLRLPQGPAPSSSSPEATPFDERVSYLHYAAYCGLRDYVLSALSNGDVAKSLTQSFSGASILLAALMGPESQDLALELIDKGIGLDDVVEITDPSGYFENTEGQQYDPSTAPSAWVLALVVAFQRLIESVSSKHPLTMMKPCERIFQRLLEHSLRIGEKVSMVLEAEWTAAYDVDSSGIPPEYHQSKDAISAGDALLWLKHLYYFNRSWERPSLDSLPWLNSISYFDSPWKRPSMSLDDEGGNEDVDESTRWKRTDADLLAAVDLHNWYKTAIIIHTLEYDSHRVCLKDQEYRIF